MFVLILYCYMRIEGVIWRIISVYVVMFVLIWYFQPLEIEPPASAGAGAGCAPGGFGALGKVKGIVPTRESTILPVASWEK